MDIRSKQTFDILNEVVDIMDKTIIVDEIEVISTGRYKIYTGNTLWLTLGYDITINTVDYTIVDLMPNEWVEVTGASEPDTEAFDIYEPFFDHGDILAQNQKMNRIPDSTQKLPLIWLHEKTNEKFNNDDMSIIDRESNCDIYFLIDNNIKDWLQLDEDRYTLKPMRNLVNSFIDACNEYVNILQPFEYDINDAPNFGSYVDGKGNVKQIFKDRVSGCQLKSTFTFLIPQCE